MARLVAPWGRDNDIARRDSGGDAVVVVVRRVSHASRPEPEATVESGMSSGTTQHRASCEPRFHRLWHGRDTTRKGLFAGTA